MMFRRNTFLILITILVIIAGAAVVLFNFYGLSLSPTRQDPDVRQQHPNIVAVPSISSPSKRKANSRRKPSGPTPVPADEILPADHVPLSESGHSVIHGADSDDVGKLHLPALQTLSNVDRCPAAAGGGGGGGADAAEVADGSTAATAISRHFSISPPVMSTEYLEEMVCKANKINKKNYPGVPKKIDSEKCGKRLPECAFWSCMHEKGKEMMQEKKKQQQHDSKKKKKKGGANEMDDDTAAISAASELKTVRKCCYEHGALRDTAWWVIGLLESSNITYFLSTGTALGALRHNGVIIPWDTDVDIAIFPEDAPRVKQLFQQHSHLHHFHKDRLGKKMFWVHHSRNGRPADGPHVEIFYEADYTKHLDSLLPLQRCSFYGRKAWCPNEKMFNVWFPSGWKNYGGAHYHDDGRCTVYMACTGKRIEKLKC